MKWFLNISKILVSLIVIVSLNISVDYNHPILQNKTSIYNTTILTSKEDVMIKAIDYTTSQKLLLFSNSINSDIDVVDWSIQIPEAEVSYLVNYKIQNHTLLKYKSLLLNIKLNDIIQQKSHWI